MADDFDNASNNQSNDKTKWQIVAASAVAAQWQRSRLQFRLGLPSRRAINFASVTRTKLPSLINILFLPVKICAKS